MQQTLTQAFTLEGVGIHTGTNGRVTVHPAETDFGRVFRVGNTLLPAQAEYVTDTARCTRLGKEGVQVSTVEHLLSALHGLSIDNALIEVEGAEVPILDGSALPWVEAIQAAGVTVQNKPPKTLFLPESLAESGWELEEGASKMQVFPCDHLVLETVTEFANWPEGNASVVYSVVGTQHVVSEQVDDYAERIAPARTFAFRQEVEMLLAAGLAKGGSLDNALVITPPDGFSTPLRLPQEWCVHKALDIMGDLALVDARLNLRLKAVRPGHRINTLLARELRQRFWKED